jgi:nicotinate-nucleotide--dimethylbenzimidazole phosphoribosyltransferase
VSNTIEKTVGDIRRGFRPEIAQEVQARWDALTKPRGSLGRLEESIVKLAQIQDAALPRLERRGMFVFCGEHGIAEEGVSLYPAAVTREMAKNFVAGGAAINVLCRQLGIETHIVDAGLSGAKVEGVLDRRVADGARNFLRERAMTREQAVTALERGIELGREAATRFDVAGVGEMGIGNSTSASAILCAFTGARAEETVGRGAGLDDAGVRHKCKVVAAALERHRVEAKDPVGVTAAFGGFEIAMMAGFLLGAAAGRLAVVVDGFISGAAFLIARGFYAEIGAHVFFGHQSAERGHARLLEFAGARPLLALDLRLGEGTGAALAMGLLVSSLALYREMATFAEAAVTDK